MQQWNGQQPLTHVPLASQIQQHPEKEPAGTSPEGPFPELLEERLEADEAGAYWK